MNDIMLQGFDMFSLIHAWDPINFMKGITKYIGNVGKEWCKLLGTICLLVAAWAIFKIVTDKNGRTPWIVTAILTLVAGGFLVTLGWDLLGDIGGGMGSSIKQMGG